MDKHTQSRITQLREQIDELDSQILELINQRLMKADEIGKIKEQGGVRVLDKNRENMIFQRLSSLNQGPVSREKLRHIYAEIMAISRDIQTPWVISFSGPESDVTHAVAMDHFGHHMSFIAQKSIKDVFHEVERGACRFGVVPIENSVQGTLNNTLDLFIESGLKICAELYQPDSYDLISKSKDGKMVDTLYCDSHGYDNCRVWIEKNMKPAELRMCDNKLDAIQSALADERSAVVTVRGLGPVHHMNTLEPGIEDAPGNVMRFIVIGKDKITRTGQDKTSIMFVTPHVPGGLVRVLEPIARAGMNMVKLESRPTRHENWQYLFFADIEGHLDDPGVQETIQKMREICLHLKHLGSYPRGG